jgi:hypothetical protein
MINPIATNSYQRPVRRTATGALRGTGRLDGAKQPPPSGAPYTPYSEQPALPEVPLQAVRRKAFA